MFGIRDRRTGEVERLWDGSPVSFGSEFEALQFMQEHFPIGTREVAALEAVAS